jgi:3-oxoacyl-[acyl-carrier protein] reductase
MRLAGKRAVVTGSSTGVGAAIARTFAREGADVAVHYRSSEKEARAVARSIAKMGRRALTLKADLSNPEDVGAMFTRVKKEFGSLDILVNCAGLADGSIWNADIDKITKEMWVKVFSVDVFGAFSCVQHALPLMTKPGSRIINIASTPVLEGDVQGLVYACGKGAVLTMTKMLARMLAPKVNVNCMILGSIKTVWLGWLSEESVSSLRSSIPMGRFGEPEEVANLAVFLASPESGYISGQGIVIDGGEVLH